MKIQDRGWNLCEKMGEISHIFINISLMLIFYHILNFTKFLKLQDEDLAPNGLLPPKDTEVKRAKNRDWVFCKTIGF